MAESVDPADSLPLGQVLAREREHQGLSRADVAQRLHMSPWQIEALEAGDYTRLPKGTFLRGFVRNYAKVLGVPADSVLSLLKEGRPHEPAPGIIVPTQNIRFDPLGDRLSSPYVKASVYALVAIAAAFAVMYWWLFVKPSTPSAEAPRDSSAEAAAPDHSRVPAPAVPAPSVAEPPRTQPAPAEPPRVEATPPRAEPTPSRAVAEPAAAPPASPPGGRETPAAAGERTLEFRFKAESWVEVRDANDRAIFQQLNAPDTQVRVVARPPFSVIVGNASEVAMRMNGQPFDLEPHARIGVARFTIR